MDLHILKMRQVSGGVEIMVTSEESPFLISNATVERGSLREGVALTTAQLARLRAEDDLVRCERSAGRYLALRDHSEGELRTKLKDKGFSEKAVVAAVTRYRDMGALDDARYAHGIARSVLERKPCGKAYLTAHLQRRKIDRRLAEETADTLLAGQDPAVLAETALLKRWKQLADLDVEKARRRAYNYLARRGFAYDISRRAFESVWNRKQKVAED
jgi:regulatory protein